MSDPQHRRPAQVPEMWHGKMPHSPWAGNFSRRHDNILKQRDYLDILPSRELYCGYLDDQAKIQAILRPIAILLMGDGMAAHFAAVLFIRPPLQRDILMGVQFCIQTARTRILKHHLFYIGRGQLGNQCSCFSRPGPAMPIKIWSNLQRTRAGAIEGISNAISICSTDVIVRGIECLESGTAELDAIVSMIIDHTKAPADLMDGG